MKRIWDTIDKNALYDFYITQCNSIEKCRRYFNCSDTPIRQALKHYGIPRRTHRDAQQLRWKRNRQGMVDQLARGRKGKPHSEEHRRKISEAQKGEKAYWYGKRGKEMPHYIHGNTSEEKRFRGTEEYTQWRLHVLARDKYQCVRCGIHCKGLHVHHIIPFVLAEEERLEDSNGATLCPSCHSWVHQNEL